MKVGLLLCYFLFSSIVYASSDSTNMVDFGKTEGYSGMKLISLGGSCKYLGEIVPSLDGNYYACGSLNKYVDTGLSANPKFIRVNIKTGFVITSGPTTGTVVLK